MSDDAPYLAPYGRHLFFCDGALSDHCDPEHQVPRLQAYLASKLGKLGDYLDPNRVKVSTSPCMGVCMGGPIAEVAPHIEANLSFIVGLPEEDPDERRVTLELIDRLCQINPKARCSVCVYMPYPGTPLWPDALARGYVPPSSQEGWTEFDLNRGNTPWVSEQEANVMCEINDILYVGRSQGHRMLKPYYGLLRWRWMNQQFGFYWEGPVKRAGGRVVENIAPCARCVIALGTRWCNTTPTRIKAGSRAIRRRCKRDEFLRIIAEHKSGLYNSPVIPAKAGIHPDGSRCRLIRWMILLVIFLSSESANSSFLRKQESIR